MVPGGPINQTVHRHTPFLPSAIQTGRWLRDVRQIVAIPRTK
jgi:hypothetical protein